jgi:hypothetical protein
LLVIVGFNGNEIAARSWCKLSQFCPNSLSGFYLLGGIGETRFAGYIVVVEDGARLVAAYPHGHRFGNSSPARELPSGGNMSREDVLPNVGLTASLPGH